MRLNIQNTAQRFFGFQSDRGTGAQKFRGMSLPESLFAVRLMSKVRPAHLGQTGWAQATRAAILRGITTGNSGNPVNQMRSPEAVVQLPGTGSDRAGRVGWIAG